MVRVNARLIIYALCLIVGIGGGVLEGLGDPALLGWIHLDGALAGLGIWAAYAVGVRSERERWRVLVDGLKSAAASTYMRREVDR